MRSFQPVIYDEMHPTLIEYDEALKRPYFDKETFRHFINDGSTGIVGDVIRPVMHLDGDSGYLEYFTKARPFKAGQVLKAQHGCDYNEGRLLWFKMLDDTNFKVLANHLPQE